MSLSPFLLIFRDTGDAAYSALSSEQRQQLLRQWNDWYDRLAAQGKVQHGHPLEPEGRIVSLKGDRITDGPFAEAKEAVGGYFFLTVESMDEATAIARQCPTLLAGLDMISIEVRRVADLCPVLRTPEQTGKMGGRPVSAVV